MCILSFAEEIRSLFSEQGYLVQSYLNKNKDFILQKVEEIAMKTNTGSFICFLSSHGDHISMACPSGPGIKYVDILNKANTEQLKDKAKVFFIDACGKYQYD